MIMNYGCACEQETDLNPHKKIENKNVIAKM